MFSREELCLHSTQHRAPSILKIVCEESAIALFRGNCCVLIGLGFLVFVLLEVLQIRYANLLCIFAIVSISSTIGFVISLSS